MFTLRRGAALGVIVQVALLAAIGTTVGLGPLGWVVGLTCGVVVNAAVARGLALSGSHALGPADLVTLSRALLAGAVAALVADAFLQRTVVTALVALAAVALVLDAVDGWVARRTRTASSFGARFDGEVDAFLILVLSVHVARSVSWWVLAIGAARYLFAVAGWLLPWLRRTLPPRYWRKVVAAVQGVVLLVVAAGVLPRAWAYVALVLAAALLAESFGRDVWWAWRHRHSEADTPPGGGRKVRKAAAGGVDVLALLLVWFALVAPNQAQLVTPGAFLRIPVEGLVVAGVAMALPRWPRRAMAAAVGALLGLVTILKVLDMGFFASLDRPFNLVTDRGYFSPVRVLARDTIGPVAGDVVLAGAVLLAVAVLVCMPLALGRLTAVLTRHRGRSVRAVIGLGFLWGACAVTGLQLHPVGPVASADAGRLAVDQVRATTAAARGLQVFGAAASVDPYRDSAGSELLTALRGKDVVIAFVESYGRVAIEGGPSSSQVRAVLNGGTRRLRESGYSSRSAFLTSPTLGGLSWLAHATLQTGLPVSDQMRYDRLLSSDRLSLSALFGRAGWRTVALMPSNRGAWPEGERFYRLDKVYDRRNIDYRGPRFGFAAMPDQFALWTLQLQELAKRDRPSVMAVVELASSHMPWAPLPELVDWDDLGDGSVFETIRDRARSATQLWRHREDVEPAYAESIGYALGTLLSFVERYGDDDLVLVLLGDHQPGAVVSGHGASRDVPVTVIARDPAVLDRITGWGWQDGLRPDRLAPVWPMDAFRDRFLAAYSPSPTRLRPDTAP